MSLNKGRPVVLDESSSEIANSVRVLAERFVGAAPSADPEPLDPNARKKFRLFARG
jgi:hypothetical protein